MNCVSKVRFNLEVNKKKHFDIAKTTAVALMFSNLLLYVAISWLHAIGPRFTQCWNIQLVSIDQLMFYFSVYSQKSNSIKDLYVY